MGTFYRDNIIGSVVKIGDRDTDIGIISGESAPVLTGDNATGKDELAKGSIYIDKSTGNWYLNVGTKANPSWMDTTGAPHAGIDSINSPLTQEPSGAVESNNAIVEVSYIAELDQAIPDVPVTFTTDFLAGEIDSVEKADETTLDVTAFVDAGVEVTTDSEGKAYLVVYFAADVNKTADITAAIDDSHEYVTTSDTEAISVTVDTTEDM